MGKTYRELKNKIISLEKQNRELSLANMQLLVDNKKLYDELFLKKEKNVIDEEKELAYQEHVEAKKRINS